MPDLIDRLTGRRSVWKPLPEDSELAQFFTDAEAALQAFQEMITAEKLLKRLLIIHGVGGIGKSSLLRMYRLSCYQQGVPVGLVGAEDAPSALDVLTAWAGDLAGMGLKLRTFAQAMDEYRALQVKVEAKASEVLKGVAGEAGKIAAKTAVEMAASAIPVVGPFAAALGGAGTEAVVDWLRGILKKPELELYLDPLERLTDNFLKDLDRVAGRQRIVLMADTYELMIGLDTWMRDLAQQLPDNLLLVISGRAVPEWDRAWQGWLGRARIVELEEMTPDDQRTLVRRYYGYVRGGEPAPGQIEAIVEFSRGLPIAVTTVVRLWVKHGIEDFHAVKPQVVADLADRLLEGVPQEIRPAFETAAVLRYFNADSLAAMLDGGGADALYAELRRWPFVRTRREGLAVHDTMREVMNEALFARSSPILSGLHQRAARYYEDRRATVRGSERDRMTLELVYHRLQVDERDGTHLLEKLFLEAERLWQRELQAKLVDEAEKHVFVERQCCHWTEYLRIRMVEHWPEREQRLKTLLSQGVDDALRVRVLRTLNQPLAYQGKREEARYYLEEALAISEGCGDRLEAGWTRLELCWQVHDPAQVREHIERAIDVFSDMQHEPGLATAELQLGWYYLHHRELVAARDAFSRSLALSQNLNLPALSAFAQERIGQTYLSQGDFSRAEQWKRRALDVFERILDQWGIAWTLDELATCYVWTGQWELALKSLQRSKEIFREWRDNRETSCVVRQAEIYRKQGRLELALEVYQQARDMTYYGTWTQQEIEAGTAYIHLATGRLDEAEDGFRQAVATFEASHRDVGARTVGNAYLGDLHMARGHYTEALEYYSSCVEAARSRESHAFQALGLVGMGQAYFQLGQPDEVEPLAREVEELGQEFGYNQFLADVHALQGDIALELNSESAVGMEDVIHLYLRALLDALRFNRFKMDEAAQEIIARCQGRGDRGQQVLVALHDFWQSGTDDEGTALLETERSAREREPGGGEPQVSVVERIGRALEKSETE